MENLKPIDKIIADLLYSNHHDLIAHVHTNTNSSISNWYSFSLVMQMLRISHIIDSPLVMIVGSYCIFCSTRHKT